MGRIRANPSGAFRTVGPRSAGPDPVPCPRAIPPSPIRPHRAPSASRCPPRPSQPGHHLHAPPLTPATGVYARGFVRHEGPSMAYVDDPVWASPAAEPSCWQCGQVLSYVRPLDAALVGRGPVWCLLRSDPNRTSGLRGPPPLAGFSDPVFSTVCPYSVRASCRPHLPDSFSLSSLPSLRRPLRRRRRSGRSPLSWPAPRPSAPSGWRGPPRPPSSACAPASRPATDPRSLRAAPRAEPPSWPP